MTYQQALDFIEYTNTLGSRLGLATVKELLFRLGNPQNQKKVIHVAGTNGKGSICAFLESILKEGGYCVGRYISPTIFTYLERFQINGEYMSETQFIQLTEQVAEVCKQMVADNFLHPTSFEVETAIAFLYFAQQPVDVILLETGMGGLEDATNVVEHPLVTTFASISMDHMSFLGDTLAKIARQKAGIMRKQVPCVISVMEDEAKQVLVEEAQKWQAPVVNLQKSDFCIKEMTLEKSVFTYRQEEYESTMLGGFQVYNAVTAIATYQLVQQQFPMTQQQVQAGVRKCRWQGRLECMNKHPYIFRDGAHNIDAVKKMKESLQAYFKEKKIHFIMGVLKDKEYAKMVAMMIPIAKSIYTVTPPVASRALQASQLAEEVQRQCQKDNVTNVQIKAFDKIEEALHTLLATIPADEVIVIFGSLSFIGNICLEV